MVSTLCQKPACGHLSGRDEDVNPAGFDDVSAPRWPRLRIALTADPELPVPPRYYGGIERIIDMLARGLVAEGHDVTLFAHRASRTSGRLIPWPGSSSASPGDTTRNLATLTRHVVGGGFDIVHSFSRLAYLGLILPMPIPKLMSFQRAVTPLTTSFANRLALGSLEFTALSHWMVSAMPLAGRWHVVPNGVPLEAYDFVPDPGPDAPLVFLGRIEEVKGPHIAIEAARRSGLPLLIAGNVPPEHETFFREQIEPSLDGETIRYIGPVDNTAKNALLGRARALLMPILWEEPFGIVMAEAMACGTPIIGFRRGAVPEVVEHNVTGFVVADVDEMVNALLETGKLDRKASRERVAKLYSAQAIVNAYRGVYYAMLGLAN